MNFKRINKLILENVIIKIINSVKEDRKWMKYYKEFVG